MAVAFDIRHRAGLGPDFQVNHVRVTFSSTYNSGGEAVTPANFGLQAIDGVIVGATSDDTNAYLVHYDISAKKLMLFNSAGDGDKFDEAGGDTLTSFTCDLLVIGHGN